MRLSGITRVHVIFKNLHDLHSTKWQVHCQVSFPGRSRSTPVPPTAGKTNTHWGENIGSLAGRPTLLWKQTLKGEKGILWIVAKIIVIEERISGHFQVLQTLHWKLTPGKREHSVDFCGMASIWYNALFSMWTLFVISEAMQCNGGTKDKSFYCPQKLSTTAASTDITQDLRDIAIFLWYFGCFVEVFDPEYLVIVFCPLLLLFS